MRQIDIIIVTGASKGIGLALLNQLQEKGKTVIGLARTRQADAKHFVTVDLAETENLSTMMADIIHQYKDVATSFTLINNAGTVEPIGITGTVEPRAIENAMTINLTAPMILCNAFISALADFEGPKKIVNISSGAGRKAYGGWGVYCTTKAGLDHFSRVVAAEQSTEKHPVEIVAIAPGIIDTDMQKTIRGSDKERFPLHEHFVDYKAQGMLSSPEETAQKLIAFMERADFNKVGPIADIRDW